MNLKEFVAESLKQIVDGIKEAQEHAAANGGVIAPHMTRKGDGKSVCYAPSFGGMHQNISFDVAVTVSEVKEQEGKAGLSIPYLNFGGKLAAEQENATVSRIKFEVPVVLPSQKQHEIS